MIYLFAILHLDLSFLGLMNLPQEMDIRTLIAVALERGIHSIQDSVVSMGTALILLLAPRLAGYTAKKIAGKKERS